MPKIKIHYFSPDAPRLKMTEKGDWIDLYCAETMESQVDLAALYWF